MRLALELPRPRLQPGGWPLTLAAGLAAAVPVIAATIKAVRDGWIPAADQGIIATRSYDVFTSHAPLVGQYSYAGHVTGKSTYSLGPMLYWLLALPAHFGSPASITWTMAALNTLAIIGVVVLARRRGGVVLMFAAAVAVALMCQSVAAETLHDIWNPSAGLLPFTLLIFLCWSLACGEYRLLPLTALVASFMLQDNLMYLPPTIGLLAVAFGGLLLSRVWPLGRRHASATDAGDPVGESGAVDTPPNVRSRGRSALRSNGDRRSLLRWSAAALAVVAICWSAPLIQQFTQSPGNMTLVVQSASRSKQTLGAGVGWHAVVRAVGVRPWWLYVPLDRWQRKHDIRVTPSTGTVASCVALLAALLISMFAGVIRGRRDVVAGALIGFVLCGALAAVAATTPTPRLLAVSLGYTMWEGSQAGMWVWLMLAWSAWLGLGWANRAWRSTAARTPSRAPERPHCVAAARSRLHIPVGARAGVCGGRRRDHRGRPRGRRHREARRTRRRLPTHGVARREPRQGDPGWKVRAATCEPRLLDDGDQTRDPLPAGAARRAGTGAGLQGTHRRLVRTLRSPVPVRRLSPRRRSLAGDRVAADRSCARRRRHWSSRGLRVDLLAATGARIRYTARRTTCAARSAGAPFALNCRFVAVTVIGSSAWRVRSETRTSPGLAASARRAAMLTSTPK